ncbi:quinone oxidoreductase family protein [Microbacterium sp. NPDC055312]
MAEMMRAYARGADPADAAMIGHALVPVPEIDADELLVRVQAVGVGTHDAVFLPHDGVRPYPIGMEGAGVVAQVGAAVSGYAVGDRIAFVSQMHPKGGTWAEYAVVRPADLILRIPAGLTAAQAAAVPVAGGTAMRALAVLGDPEPGATLFVVGASGAVGSMLVPLAVRAGWRVVASASAGSLEHVRSLGADAAVDYRSDWRAQLRALHPSGVDAAVAIPAGTTAGAMEVVRDEGAMITVSADDVAPVRGIRVSGLNYAAPVRAPLQQLLEEVQAGRFPLHIDLQLPLEHAEDALAKVRAQRARGKTVLTIDS